MANGTNMINETSLVIKIELTKQIKNQYKTNSRVFSILVNNLRTRNSKTERFFQNFNNNHDYKKQYDCFPVDIVEIFGLAKKQETIANINEIENTISFLKKSNDLSIKLAILSKINLHLLPLFLKES